MGLVTDALFEEVFLEIEECKGTLVAFGIETFVFAESLVLICHLIRNLTDKLYVCDLSFLTLLTEVFVAGIVVCDNKLFY